MLPYWQGAVLRARCISDSIYHFADVILNSACSFCMLSSEGIEKTEQHPQYTSVLQCIAPVAIQLKFGSDGHPSLYACMLYERHACMTFMHACR